MDDSMTCKELVELVTDYLEGTLPPPERDRFESHLANCEGCTNHLEQMRQTIHLVGTLTEDQIAPAAKDALLNVFKAWKKGGSGQ